MAPVSRRQARAQARQAASAAQAVVAAQAAGEGARLRLAEGPPPWAEALGGTLDVSLAAGTVTTCPDLPGDTLGVTYATVHRPTHLMCEACLDVAMIAEPPPCIRCGTVIGQDGSAVISAIGTVIGVAGLCRSCT